MAFTQCINFSSVACRNYNGMGYMLAKLQQAIVKLGCGDSQLLKEPDGRGVIIYAYQTNMHINSGSVSYFSLPDSLKIAEQGCPGFTTLAGLKHPDQHFKVKGFLPDLTVNLDSLLFEFIANLAGYYSK